MISCFAIFHQFLFISSLFERKNLKNVIPNAIMTFVGEYESVQQALHFKFICSQMYRARTESSAKLDVKVRKNQSCVAFWGCFGNGMVFVCVPKQYIIE